jgi:catechol 2,3-dioxygenase-like lactoylglutathione lyase family enzyme
MTVALTRDALDLGIVTADGSAALAFYRDTLGLTPDGEVPFPGMGVVKRLRCGRSLVRILVLDEPPPQRGEAGAFTDAIGYRYCTLSIANLEEVVEACRAAGYEIALEIRDLRPGVQVGMVRDPDGNTVELMGTSG